MNRFLLAPLLIMVFVCQAQAATEPMVRLPREAVYWVEPGDSLIGIGGEAFMLIFERNRKQMERLFGKASPGRIVAGMRLVIPKGTPVSLKTAQAINCQEEVRRNAITDLNKATILMKRLNALGGSSVEGVSLLNRSRELLLKDSGYANINYIEADNSAREASGFFTEALHAAELNSKLSAMETSLRNRPRERIIEREFQQVAVPNWPLALYVFAIVLGGMFISFAMFQRRREHKTLSFLRERLAHHRRRLQEFEA